MQCHKSLWLYKNHPELRDTPDTSEETLFNVGHDVGKQAWKLFPNGSEIKFDANNFEGMITETKNLIASGCKIIYEATFKENGIFAMVDILVKNDKAWDIYEVKASTSVKEYHLNDASIQWYALSNTLKLNRAYIVHINNQYVKDGKLDVNKLFTIEDITSEVKNRQHQIPAQLLQMKQMLQKDMPNIDIGVYCDDPYSCDFKSYCWRHIPYPSVFNLYWMSGKKKFEMYYSGVKTFDSILHDFKLNATQQLQVATCKTQKPFIDVKIIKNFLDTIEYPVSFFDFETFQNAIPRFDNQRPYMQMPFQYSLHIVYKNGQIEHKEFLADEHSDPRKDLITKMLQDIPSIGSIVAYNKSFEISRIKELADFDDKRRNKLLALNNRFIDLIVPFRKRGYYHPDFHGSFSIKSVLPAMFPNNDELDYSKVGSIQNGSDAMDTFANLHLLKDRSKRDEIRKDLLAYCYLDTLGMVRIWQKLNKIVKNKTPFE